MILIALLLIAAAQIRRLIGKPSRVIGERDAAASLAEAVLHRGSERRIASDDQGGGRFFRI